MVGRDPDVVGVEQAGGTEPRFDASDLPVDLRRIVIVSGAPMPFSCAVESSSPSHSMVTVGSIRGMPTFSSASTA